MLKSLGRSDIGSVAIRNEGCMLCICIYIYI